MLITLTLYTNSKVIFKISYIWLLVQKEKDNMEKEGKPPLMQNVAWWKVGKEALGTNEFPHGTMIDVHSIKGLGEYQFR